MELKKAVFVAAGKSSRLYPQTLDRPKPLLRLGENSLIGESIENVRSLGIEKIAVVVGYLSEMFEPELGPDIEYIYNPFYEHCNNLGSLWMARNFVGKEPFMYLHSDLAYEKEMLEKSCAEFQKNDTSIQLIVDYGETDEEAMKVLVNNEGYLLESNKEIHPAKAAGEWTGIAFVRDAESVFKYFEDDMKNNGLNNYDTNAFTKMVQDGHQIWCSSTHGHSWIEIDTAEDFSQAKKLFGK